MPLCEFSKQIFQSCVRVQLIYRNMVMLCSGTHETCNLWVHVRGWESWMDVLIGQQTQVRSKLQVSYVISFYKREFRDAEVLPISESTRPCSMAAWGLWLVPCSHFLREMPPQGERMTLRLEECPGKQYCARNRSKCFRYEGSEWQRMSSCGWLERWEERNDTWTVLPPEVKHQYTHMDQDLWATSSCGHHRWQQT